MSVNKEVRDKYFGNSRRTWTIAPVTKVIQSKKTYKRNREKRRVNDFLRED